MKYLILICVIMPGFILNVQSGETSDPSPRLIGVGLYHSYSASGYGSGLNMNISIEKDNRLLEAGAFLQHGSFGIPGGEVLYRHYLASPYKNNDPEFRESRVLRIFFQYNFIFRHSTPSGMMETTMHSQGEEIVSGGRVATYEHYAGMGSQVLLFDNLYAHTSLGYGIILGSLDYKFLHEPHYSEGGRKYDSGLSFKLGIAYIFQR